MTRRAAAALALCAAVPAAMALTPGADAPARVSQVPTPPPPPPTPLPPPATPLPPLPPEPPPRCADQARGRPFAGRLAAGVQLPGSGEHFFTWDPVRHRSPNRSWRRWGTQHTIDTLQRVIAQYRQQDPLAPRVGIQDISRRRGGIFDRRFGGLGHSSHQNGLDVDIAYPRRDGLELGIDHPREVHLRRSQRLVDLLVDAGATYVFVGPRLRLRGPRKVVVRLVHHDDHVHVRFRCPPEPAKPRE